MEKRVIEDLKETIHRLQQECTEKTDIIETLVNKNKELQDELQIAIEALEEIVDRRNQCSKCSDYEAGYCFGTSECWEDDIKSAQQALERIKE